MSYEDFILHFYYQNLCKSTASDLKNKWLKTANGLDWLRCRELMDIYSKMKHLQSAPNFYDSKMIISGDTFKSVISNDPKSVGVIIETRKSRWIEPVVTNFIARTGLSVQFFHGVSNRDFILSTTIQKHIDAGKVILCELNTDQLSASDYNRLLLSKMFWKALVGREKIFVFQIDSWICEKSKFSLNDFLQFDYIGSKWSRKRPVELILDGGSGGLSIRDWRKSVECLETFPPELWSGGEDGYFAFHIELLGGKVGKPTDCGMFSTQEYFTHKSYGAHKISLLPKPAQLKFIDYCPEAKFLLNN